MKCKERPRNRKVIEKLLGQGHTLHSIINCNRYNDLQDGRIIIEQDNCSYVEPKDMGLETPRVLGFFSDGLKLQARKMLIENKSKGGKTKCIKY